MIQFKSILTKILVPVISMVVILTLVIAVTCIVSFQKYAAETFKHTVQVRADNIEREVNFLKTIAHDQIVSLARLADVAGAIEEADKDKLQTILDGFEANMKCDYFTILNEKAEVIFRTSSPANSGDSQRNLRSVSTALATKDSCVFYDSTQYVPLSVRAAAPVVDENNNLIGLVTGGFRLDNLDWVDLMKHEYEVECTIFKGDERIATTVKDAQTGERAVGTKLDNPEIHDKVFGQRKEAQGKATVVGQPMIVNYAPIYNEGDDTVLGMIFVGVSMQEQYDALVTEILWSLGITAISLIIFIPTVIFLIRRIVTAPMKQSDAILRQIANEGKLDTEIPSSVLGRKDEIGSLCRGVKHIQNDYNTLAALATELAHGNWCLSVKEKGQEDTMNQSFSTMLDKMNQALFEISEGVKQVTTGSGEVSSAAQSLSSGAQESAASLEEITASMSEISSQTKANAEDAGQAREWAHQASIAATEGQTAMQNMIVAMRGITQNSNEIQRVIKVIDDIAFQTNLLALNAAVEAARAGQHGKGFAVVAEEVRNLASRSAKAAQETSELIKKSGYEITKGDEVANHTAGVLDTIVEQIKKTTDLVNGIAVASNEQAQGVNQVTIGLQQIDSVTQQNTALAEESASAATEMSSMATNLQKLVAQFQLRQ